MKWLAYELARQGHPVLEKKDKDQNWLEKLCDFSKQIDEQYFYMIADDVFRDELVLDELEQSPTPFPFTLIGTTRLSEDQHESLDGLGYKLNLINLNRPSRAEKRRILVKVCQDSAIKSRLASMPIVERERLMAAPAMLVLMLQITQGKPFDQIIAEIVKKLPNKRQYPVYQVFGAICSFFQYGIVIPTELLPLCLPQYSSNAIQVVLDSIERAELAGLVRTTRREGFEGLAVIHELIAQQAMQLHYKPRQSENQPYQRRSLESHLVAIIQSVCIAEKTYKSWVCNVLKLLTTAGKISLVYEVLNKYPKQIKALQEGNTVSDWLNWVKVYEAIGLPDEQVRCRSEVLLAKPHSSLEWIQWLSHIEKFGTEQQKKDAISQATIWFKEHPNNREVLNKHLALTRRHGTQEQQQEVIDLAASWLKEHLAWEIYRYYLALLENHRKAERKQEAINEMISRTANLLQKHPNDQGIFKQCRILVRNCL